MRILRYSLRVDAEDFCSQVLKDLAQTTELVRLLLAEWMTPAVEDRTWGVLEFERIKNLLSPVTADLLAGGTAMEVSPTALMSDAAWEHHCSRIMRDYGRRSPEYNPLEPGETMLPSVDRREPVSIWPDDASSLSQQSRSIFGTSPKLAQRVSRLADIPLSPLRYLEKSKNNGVGLLSPFFERSRTALLNLNASPFFGGGIEGRDITLPVTSPNQHASNMSAAGSPNLIFRGDPDLGTQVSRDFAAANRAVFDNDNANISGDSFANLLPLLLLLGRFGGLAPFARSSLISIFLAGSLALLSSSTPPWWIYLCLRGIDRVRLRGQVFAQQAAAAGLDPSSGRPLVEQASQPPTDPQPTDPAETSLFAPYLLEFRNALLNRNDASAPRPSPQPSQPSQGARQAISTLFPVESTASLNMELIWP